MGKKAKAKKLTSEGRKPARSAKAIADSAALSPARSESPEHSDVLRVSRALADPTRLAVLRAIAEGNGTCGVLRESLGISAATLSHHMKELEAVDLIVLAREGRFLQSRLNRATWKQHLAMLKDFAH